MKHTVLFLFFIVSGFLASGQAALRQKNLNLKNGVAIDGYDPVSYFKNKPERGSASSSYAFEGATYYFTSSSNLAAFKQNPARYEPQYGGWCAYAMGSKGEKVEVDPQTYKIVNGKLYLFYNHLLNNTLKKWDMNEAPLMQKADINWRKVNQ